MSEINLQEQFDQPFLLAKSYSPGEVAKHFNKVAKLDEIDIGLKNINSSINSINREQKVRESDLKIAEEDIKEYDHLEKFEAEVEALEALDDQISNYTNSINKLRDLMASIGEVNTDIAYQKEIIKDEDLVNDVLELTYQIEEKDQELAGLQSVLTDISNVNVSINRQRTDLVVLERKYEKDFPDVCPLCDTPHICPHCNTIIKDN